MPSVAASSLTKWSNPSMVQVKDEVMQADPAGFTAPPSLSAEGGSRAM
jgi:hypothetical protein